MTDELRIHHTDSMGVDNHNDPLHIREDGICMGNSRAHERRSGKERRNSVRTVRGQMNQWYDGDSNCGDTFVWRSGDDRRKSQDCSACAHEFELKQQKPIEGYIQCTENCERRTAQKNQVCIYGMAVCTNHEPPRYDKILGCRWNKSENVFHYTLINASQLEIDEYKKSIKLEQPVFEVGDWVCVDHPVCEGMGVVKSYKESTQNYFVFPIGNATPYACKIGDIRIPTLKELTVVLDGGVKVIAWEWLNETVVHYNYRTPGNLLIKNLFSIDSIAVAKAICKALNIPIISESQRKRHFGGEMRYPE